MEDYKIIFSGPVGAGKTTAIAAISDAPPVQTDEQISTGISGSKTSTTVAMDYGTITLASGEKVHLYGTPGQKRFDFMWDILSEGGIGVVLLIDNTAGDPITDLDYFLKAFREFSNQQKLVVGVTQMDLKACPDFSAYYQYMESSGQQVPIMEIDARDSVDVSKLLEVLLFAIDPGFA